MSRWIVVALVVIVTSLVLGAIVIGGEHRPTDRERIEEACGGDPSHLGSIPADGRVCCDLCIPARTTASEDPRSGRS